MRRPTFFDKRTVFLIIALVCLNGLMAALGPEYTLDKKLYYTGDQARSLINGFNTHQIQVYFVNELFDLLMILLYSTLLFVFYEKAFSLNFFLKIVPFIPGFLDLIETSYILYALKNPGPHLFFNLLGLATFMKWVSGAFLVVVLIWKLLKEKT